MLRGELFDKIRLLSSDTKMWVCYGSKLRTNNYKTFRNRTMVLMHGLLGLSTIKVNFFPLFIEWYLNIFLCRHSGSPFKTGSTIKRHIQTTGDNYLVYLTCGSAHLFSASTSSFVCWPACHYHRLQSTSPTAAAAAAAWYGTCPSCMSMSSRYWD